MRSSFLLVVLIASLASACSGQSVTSCDGADTCRVDGAPNDTPAVDATSDTVSLDAPGPALGTLGATCVNPTDCHSGICLSIDRCSETCTMRSDCPSGNNWMCEGVPGLGTVCVCTPHGTVEVGCNGLDDDCDGITDPHDGTCGGSCFDLWASNANCGACGIACAGGSTCQSGVCNCPSDHATVCGTTCTNIAGDPLNCGTCGNACPATANGLPGCTAGVCSAMCDPGFGDCDGNPGNGCETDVRSATANCGSCGHACTFAHAGAACSTGTCVIGACDTGYSDCDSSTLDGCESMTSSDLANCGACGHSCVVAHATSACSAGVCSLTACASGFGDCDGSAADGCEASLETDPLNCGTCGGACPGATSPNTVAMCAAGACGFTCATGFGDCDGIASNGCETRVDTEMHCGTCTTVCPVGAMCGGGVCSTCPSGEARCGGFCVGVLTDVENCGSCGHVCPTGATCASGACACPSGQVACGPTCSDLMTENANCGACGNACASDEMCDSGVCRMPGCPAAQSYCSGYGCAETTTDPSNCGSCGHMCPSGEYCVAGNCESSCPWAFSSDSGGHCYDALTDWAYCNNRRGCSSEELCEELPESGTPSTSVCVGACESGLTACSGACVNLQSHPANCGACGHACSATQFCVSGACTTCPAAQSYCSGYGCAETTTDPSNCGSCGHMCPSGEYCVAGNCESSCPWAFSSDSGGHCYDALTDWAYCNNRRGCSSEELCEELPESGTPSTSVCVGACESGLTACSGACVNLQSHPANCGACGHACSATQFCVSGACTTCPAAQSYCSGYGCAETTTDPSNCGSCGHMCPSGEYCVAGNCESSCPWAFSSDSGGHCYDALTDWAYCNNRRGCSSEELCEELPESGTPSTSVCVGACESGLTACSGACVNLQSHPANCGACGHACSATQFCVSGACTTCPAAQSYCSGYGCAETTTDPSNCGSCGHMCPSGEYCVAGNCESSCPWAFSSDSGGHCYDALTDWAYCNNRRGCSSEELCEELPESGTPSTSVCVGACESGLTACSGACVNLQSHPANCGACGHACSATQFCVSGACTTCPAAQSYCSGYGCAETTTDPSNCGSCGHMCPSGEYCVAGNCESSCPWAFSSDSGGHCYDALTDWAYCNNRRGCSSEELCEELPESGTPSTSVCVGACESGLTACSGACVNLQSHPANCGACGHACSATQFCAGGVCVGT